MDGRAAVRVSFIDHVLELRRRLMWSVLTLLLGAAVGYSLQDSILRIILRPLGNQLLYYSSPTGGFNFLFQICLFFGLLLSIPVFTYNILKFIEPVMPHRARFLLLKLLAASTGLVIAGTAFAYFVSIPAALHFLNSFSTEAVRSLISTNEYLSFVMTYLAGFAILFQLPLIMLFINRITPLPPGRLMKQQRYVIVGSFIIAAILTPTPDPMNQTIMAAPMILLYQISVFLVWLTDRRKPRPQPPEAIIHRDPAPVQQAPLPKPQPLPAPQTSRGAVIDLRPAAPPIRTNVLDLRSK